MTLDTMRESVGIRQVTHNGVKLPGCTRLDIVGGDLEVVTDTDSVQTYRLDLSALEARIEALEAKRFSVTPLKSANYTAASWEHVLVDMDAASGDLSVTLPASPAVNDRVKITDISQEGGYGNGFRLRVACTFAVGSLGNWAASPFSVAYSAGQGGSLKGASCELVYIGTGWIIASETCSVANLL